ncbi:MAG: NAD-dependent epimerase/dehydratase family protein [Lachnospiraceae bacterium]|nr:NAD-dependent epimerase/dehydratase family protein [Lachnospiraceae bacterium]
MKYDREYWDDAALAAERIPRLETLYGKTLLITGGTGMICSAVIDVIVWLNCHRHAGIRLILAGRSRERAARRFDGVLKETEYQFLPFEATAPQIADVRADYFLHGAGNANPAVYAKEPVETLVGNIVGLRSMLEAARKNPCSRLLFISSSEVYGNRADRREGPFREDEYGYVDILNPRACYPDGKRAAETLCAAYRQEYGVDFVIVRPGHIYGPSVTDSDTRASASFSRDAAAGRDIVMKSTGEQRRSYCYTLDCASAILAVLLNGEDGEAYNISNRNSIASVREVAEALAAAGGVRVVYECPSETERKSYNPMNHSVLDSEKLEGLGWRGVFGLKEGTERTLRYL